MEKKEMVHVNYYFDEDVLIWLKKRSEEERRSVSAIIRYILLNEMKKEIKMNESNKRRS